MQKPLNLTDMLWHKSEARAERAQDKGKLARPAAPRAQAEFIPEAPAQADQAEKARRTDKAHRAGPKPFADRVRESQARLSGKDHSFFKQPGRPEAHRPEAQRNEARPETARPEAKASDSRDARECGNTDMTHGRGASARAEAAQARAQARKAGKSDPAEAPAGTWTPGESRPISLEAVEAGGAGALGDWEEADLEGGARDYDALQARLEELGIELTPEQLRDPAFLAEMLWMIDGIPMSLPLFPEAMVAEGGMPAADASGAAAGPAAPALPAVPVAPAADAALAATDAAAASAASATEAGVEDAMTSVPAESFDWTAVEEPEREEIAALLREKLGALADKPELKAGPASLPLSPAAAAAAGLADALTPNRGEVRLDMGLPKADVAMADPDRLRVLQAAGLNGMLGPQGRDVNSLQVDLGDGKTSDASLDLDLDPRAPVSHADAKGGKQGDGLPDLLGRNPGQAAEVAGLREGAAAKDVSGSGAASAFQSAIDQARASEARLAQAKEAGMPMAHAQEQTVLAQIARKMSALGLRGTEEIRIQLEPEHLGRVRIAIEMRDGALTARIAVENDAVRQIVDSNMAGLRTSLEEQGIKVQGMEVSVEHKHASLFNPDGSNAREFFHRRGQGGSDGQGEAGREDSAESDTGRRMGYNTLEFIA